MNMTADEAIRLARDLIEKQDEFQEFLKASGVTPPSTRLDNVTFMAHVATWMFRRHP